MMLRRLLVAFDFDHTIINKNSDLVVRDLIPSEKIPTEVKELYRSDGWTLYMQKIFDLLHSNGVTRDQIQSSVKSIPVTPGFDKLLSLLKQETSDVIIISDSNSQFISDWLVDHSLDNTVSQIFTNPAHYDSDGCLKIEMYHTQDWCELSSKNLCKGYILESYIKEKAQQGITFSTVAYVGDGKNDLCPCLRLSANDLAFPRVGYSLMEAIKDIVNSDKQDSLKAKVYPWNTGSDILQVISQYV
ncbi:pyridoxal phosphate phosphatase PHOSPHO2 [Anabrus simplex]|uniref:pyridoxal phosphate phosphatase PHOSPHO2 n=1 Tax=Anabrus simplex TaxID=316456 RepID=UPI0035A33CBD